MTNEWMKPEHAAAYLARMEDIPHRIEGESTLLSEVPVKSKRILDLGCGDGRLLSLALSHCPDATGVGLDLSATMLEQARRRFDNDDRVSFVRHDMDGRLPDLGTFDCVVSSFAIHHCHDNRKQQLYTEVFSILEPGGVFCNLEHVSSPTDEIHNRFVRAMKMTPEDEDPSNKLLDVETQLRWLKEIGFEQVDCYWKWRELALLIGFKPLVRGTVNDGTIDDAPNPAEVQWLNDQLNSYNECHAGSDDLRPVNLVVRNQGNVIAGLQGVTGWGWLYVQVVWVHENHRRTRLGSRLLERAEQMAQQRGCIGTCLSSYSFQAPEFYEQHGYSAFGQIDDYPVGNTMLFMSKRFDQITGNGK